MSSPDDRPSRLSVSVDNAWLERVDEWRKLQPRPVSRTEAIRRLVKLGLESEPANKAAKPRGKASLPASAADFYIHAKTVSAFNGVLSILAVLVAKKVVDRKDLARIHDAMSKPFSGKRDQGRYIIADAQRRLDDLLAQLGRSLRRPRT